MLPGEINVEVLQAQINELKRSVEVSGIAPSTLMGCMLASSLAQIDRAVDRQDWQTVEHGLQTTRTLLLQCTI